MADVWKIGSLTTDTLTGRTIIGAIATGAAGGHCFQVAGADYVVTAGKTFHITGIVPILVTAGSSLHMYIRYADDAALTTNPVNLFEITDLADPVPIMIPCNISVAAGKYVGIFNSAAVLATAAIIGYEE